MTNMNLYSIFAAVLFVVGVYSYGHHAGYAEKESEDTALIAQENQDMQKSKEKADAQLAQVKQQLASKQSQLLNAIRSGDQRLYVNVRTPSGCAASELGETRAELDPKTSESLVTITGDGDKAIADLNYCIDRYEAVRKELQ